MHNFTELKVWNSSIDLVEIIYKVTEEFPKSEQFGLTNQMRRCSVSTPSNIAEGSERTDKEFGRFISISLSSAFELETQLIIANRLKYINSDKYNNLIDSIKSIEKMLYSFRMKLI